MDSHFKYTLGVGCWWLYGFLLLKDLLIEKDTEMMADSLIHGNRKNNRGKWSPRISTVIISHKFQSSLSIEPSLKAADMWYIWC